MTIPTVEQVEHRVRQRLLATGAISLVERGSLPRRPALFLALDPVTPQERSEPSMGMLELRVKRSTC